IVDPGAAAPEPVQSLNLKGKGNDDADEGHHVQVVPELRHALGGPHEVGEHGEADDVGEAEGDHAETGIAEDVEGDEQPIVPTHHCGGVRSASAAATASWKSVMKRSRENRSACARNAGRSRGS